MRVYRSGLKAAAGLMFVAMPMLAHHSFAAEYDENHLVTLRGTITKVSWKNPHVTLNLNATNESGKVVNWEVEMASPNGLMRQGWKIDSVKQGDRVVVTGFGARDGSHVASATKVVLGGAAYSAVR
ncbi:MAG: DUF6152 family protein [Acidobacteriota bacterium]